MTEIGLCADCENAQIITSDRGAKFHRCGLSFKDPRFPKYPQLPVLRCTGWREVCVVIREIQEADAADAARLAAELGYPVEAAIIAERVKRLGKSDRHAVYVAEAGGRVVGWIDIGVVEHLQSGPYGEIGGLVVEESARGRGIGTKLVRRAEQWVRERGVQTLLVRSRVERAGAHRFYLREGFEQTKTSAVFSKKLPH